MANKERDEDVQALVANLREQLKEKTRQLTAVQEDNQLAREKINERSKERQNFLSNTLHIDEVAELVAEHQQLRETLQSKQAQLTSLNDGSAQELRDLERAREQMLELQKQQTTVSTQREQDMQAVEELRRQNLQVKETCSETRARLEKAQQQLSEENELRNKEPTTVSRKPLSVRLDRFLIATCKKAGLKLS